MPEEIEKSLLSQIREKEDELNARLNAERDHATARRKEAEVEAQNVIERAHEEGIEAASAHMEQERERTAREAERLKAEGEATAVRVKEEGMDNIPRAADLIVRKVAPGGSDASKDAESAGRRTAQ
ncbi:MAG: V-type ATPase subunit subunit G family protein [Methanomicrobiales archaeon]